MERESDNPLRHYQETARSINEREPETRVKSDDDLRTMTADLKARLRLQPRTSARRPHLTLVPKSDSGA